MVNPLTSQNYKEGDTIYLIKDQTTRQDDGKGEDGGSIDQYAAFLQMTDAELMKALESAPLSVTSRGTFEVIGDKLLRNDGSTLTSDFPQVTMPAFRAMLRKASATERNK